MSDLKLHNTLTRRIEAFAPADGKNSYARLLWSRGTLYGTTSSDASIGGGTVFSYYVEPYLTLSGNAGSMTASWSAIAGSDFQLQSKASLNDLDWTNLGSPITATNSVVTQSGLDGSQPQQFYRVLVK